MGAKKELGPLRPENHSHSVSAQKIIVAAGRKRQTIKEHRNDSALLSRFFDSPLPFNPKSLLDISIRRV
jgi:hypothetical protein